MQLYAIMMCISRTCDMYLVFDLLPPILHIWYAWYGDVI